MKKILLILIIIFIGCTKSSEEPNNTPPELIGKWKIVEIFSTDGGEPATWALYDSGEAYDLWLKQNGTYSDPNTDETCNNGSYLISDNQITFSPCASEYPLTIENLTQSTLILRDNFIPDIFKTKYIKVVE